MEVNIFSSTNKSLIFCMEDIKKQIKEEMNSYDFILFAISPSFPIQSINSIIKRVFKNTKYAAFHAIEAFQNCNIIEQGVVATVFRFEKSANINLFYQEDICNEETLTETANYLNSNSDKLHIIISSFINGEFGFFIDKLSTKLNYNPINNIVGGISSGIEVNGELLTSQFINNKIIKNGFIIISFENVKFEIDISLGFKPYGITYKITKSEKSKIYEVDNGKKFPDIIKAILKDIKNIDIKYLWYTPINILDEDTGYVSTLRTIETFNDKYVKFFGPIKNNQHFKISFATYKDLLEEDEKIAKRVLEKISLPDVIFNFSCIAREYVLEEYKDYEIRTYTDILNAHLFGFFTFGEIGPDKEFTHLKLYNETSLLLAIKEI